DQLVVGLLTELAGTGRAALSLGEQGSLADRERRGTSGHLCFPFRELEPRHVEPLTCGRRVGTQLLELIAVLRRRLARVCRFLRFGREPCTLGLERAFALLELTRTRCENAVQLSELRLASGQVGGSGLDVLFASREQLFRVRMIGVELGRPIATEAQAVPPFGPELRLAPLDVSARVFDLELARGDLDRTLAQLALQIRQLRELLVAKPLALLGEVAGEAKHLVALELSGAADVPVVALPRVLVRLHLHGI